jgi:uncharacterized membrane protein
MLVYWPHAGPTALAAFFASLVEGVEALTVVLAVGTVRGWRTTLLGTGAGIGVLLLAVAILGPALTWISLDAVRAVVGTLLLLFGLRWLHKAILRSAGVIALHDEAAIYARQQQALRGMHASATRWDTVAFVLAFKSVVLEGTEVVFIVLALAAGRRGLLWPASLGAIAALAAVALAGIAVRRPLARIPENSLKFVVGVLLSAFGTYWAGEGLRAPWPGHDWAILGLIAAYLAVAAVAARLCRWRVAMTAQAAGR